MDFSGFGGLALAVVAGLWLMVFVPSWFKRSQERERGSYAPRTTKSRSRKVTEISSRITSDNFIELARSLSQEPAQQSAIVERAWVRNELPTPTTLNGSIESVEFAKVVEFSEAQTQATSRKLEQSELDEILRRRRANG